MNYSTRQRVHPDRLTSAWAVRKFVDPEATFQFIPPHTRRAPHWTAGRRAAADVGGGPRHQACGSGQCHFAP
jgi:hypothetical protein